MPDEKTSIHSLPDKLPVQKTDKVVAPERFGGRPVIKSGSKINGGVFVDENKKGIVVDDSNSRVDRGNDLTPQQMKDYARLDYYNYQFRNNVEDNPPLNPKEYDLDMLKHAFIHAKGWIPDDPNKANSVLSKTEPGKKTHLLSFIGGGLPEHQMLLAAYVLERAKADYQMGEVSVERNFIPGKGERSWLKYTSRDGQDFIMDFKSGFVGPAKDATANTGWQYDTAPKAAESNGGEGVFSKFVKKLRGRS